jgi:L-malate glycosyltransferase
MFSLHIDTARTWRGGQNQVLITVLGLRAAGHRTMLVAHAGGELRRRAAEGLELLPITPRTEMDLSAAWRLSRAIKTLRPDVVHAHDPHGVAMAALGLSMSTQPRRAPLVASRRVDFRLHGNALSRWKYDQVDCFICASEAIRRILVADGIAEPRTVTVHEGIDLGHVAAAPVVEAAALVVRQVPDARFVIAGEGDLRQALEHQIKHLNLEKNVLLAGFRPDILSVHKGFDIFVMSSVTEGLGTSLLDAMACAKPVVATTAGGIPEVVADGVTGILVPPRDAQAMANAIVRLLKDEPLRRRMGDAGLSRVQAKFSAERMVAETIRVYEQVTKKL